MRLSVHVEAGRHVQGHDRLEHHHGGIQGTRALFWGECVLFLLQLVCLVFSLQYIVSFLTTIKSQPNYRHI